MIDKKFNFPHCESLTIYHSHLQEQLFVSKRSVFDGKKPIRGGIPFVFPVFGASNILPPDGFARITRWQLEKGNSNFTKFYENSVTFITFFFFFKGPDRLHTGDVEAIFSLSDSEYTRSMWNCSFRVTYRYKIIKNQISKNLATYHKLNEIE